MPTFQSRPELQIFHTNSSQFLGFLPVSPDPTSPGAVRIIAASRKNIYRLRQDASVPPELLQYFAAAVISLPPLRERHEDIPVLARHFASVVCAQHRRPLADFTRRATATMRYHEWPENVRELKRRIQAAIVDQEATVIDAQHLALDSTDLRSVVPLLQAKESFALEYILDVLDLNGGNKSKTARDLDVDPRTIFRYIEGK